jgi:transglutaminase-like putative cysteine protease
MGKHAMNMAEFLAPGQFVDSESPEISDFVARSTARVEGSLERICALFNSVRDLIEYDLYIDLSDPANYTARGVLSSGRGFCVGKAALFAACARNIGIPARVGYADVRNHMSTPKILKLIGTDIFRWHSYTELWLSQRWVKATPAFNAALCERIGVSVLGFDGQNDALLQACDKMGRRHMEYLNYRGEFADVPYSTIVADFRRHYPLLMAAEELKGNFNAEATTD